MADKTAAETFWSTPLDEKRIDWPVVVDVQALDLHTFGASLQCLSGLFLGKATARCRDGCLLGLIPPRSRVQILFRRSGFGCNDEGAQVDDDETRRLDRLKQLLSEYPQALVVVRCAVALDDRAVGRGGGNGGSTGGETPASLKLTTSGAVILCSKRLHSVDMSADDASVRLEPKAERHRVFASWLASSVLLGVGDCEQGHGSCNRGIVDIAGGRRAALSTALLAVALTGGGSGGPASAAAHAVDSIGEERRSSDGLSSSRHMTCTVVDPQAAAVPENICDADRYGGKIFALRCTVEDFLAKLSAEGVSPSAYSAWLAMHPDAATDAMVDAALAARRPWACVPCCVFKRRFPFRRTRAGLGVGTYSSLVRYLREKDPRIRVAHLGFQGRNTVLFMTASDYQRVVPSWKSVWKDDGWFEMAMSRLTGREGRCEDCDKEEDDCEHDISESENDADTSDMDTRNVDSPRR
eukprot:TRINITY_DN75845_c0_g1_i1.p1 TRINITY_DN75845_c0_g1~~TRINITY_DN75845_c0_g1_i1.p1  ORF type:complete len:482 (-),score=69.06 TRINITY_DN75845_c0_g1_i1:12-1412(-)